MSNQAMTKLASEFYERGRQAALIEAGLVKVANKKKTLAALLGLGGAGAGGFALSRYLKSLAKSAPAAKAPSAPLPAIPEVTLTTPNVARGLSRVDELLNPLNAQAAPLIAAADPRLAAAAQRSASTGEHMLTALMNTPARIPHP